MTHTEAKTRHAKLVEEIRRYDQAYDVGREIITDYEYDQKMAELQRIEDAFSDLSTDDSPTKRVRPEPVTKFKRLKHLVPMLSLEKIQASDHPTKNEEPNEDKRKILQDENTIKELFRFDATIKKQLGKSQIEYVVEPKVDGVSISVHYRNGKLTLGMTRGDGKEGDDITQNIRQIRNIPHELKVKNAPTLLEIRGEAYISQKDFEAMNSKLEKEGEEPFPNARNATAGTLKQLDPNLVKQRPISAVFYAVGAYEAISFHTHSEVLESLKEFGLPTQKYWWLCDGMNEVLAHYREKIVSNYNQQHDLRSKLPYEIDGIVIKVNNMSDWERIPAKTKAPGYAIVHKPIPWITPAETILKGITIQVGRTGVLTPVAELEPVFVQGSTVARATLHNEDEIHRKDIRIGDTVVVRKAGMVIPEVVEVVLSKRPEGTSEFNLEASVGGKCPVCGGPIARDPEFVVWRCQNVAGCPAQSVRRVEFMAQRSALDIEGVGGVVSEKLVERGLVKEPLDLFLLTRDKLAKLNLGSEEEPRVFGEKNATKVTEALERAKNFPLSRWLFALGIQEVGETTAYEVARFHKNLVRVASSSLLKGIAKLGSFYDELAVVSPFNRGNTPRNPEEKASRTQQYESLKTEILKLGEELQKEGVVNRNKKWEQLTQEKREKTKAVPEFVTIVGTKVAKNIIDFFDSKTGQKVLSRLQKLGIDPMGAEMQKSVKKTESLSPFAGKTLVITGTLSTMSRDGAFEKIRAAGGDVSTSISSKTDYLVVGENAGSKLEKAEKLGVEVLDEKTFLKLLEEETKPVAKPKSGNQQNELF